jgi:type IV secretory pathway VirJ component
MRWLKLSLWLLLASVLIGLGSLISHLVLPRNFTATGEMLPLKLAGGPLLVPYYSGPTAAKGIIILGTGDGGWSYWEENTARHLAQQGFVVGGWDCRKFADTRSYDQAQLSAGFKSAVAAVIKRCHGPANLPVWYAGWSTGADQSVAAAAAAVGDRPAHLVGLLLAAPGTRGRYGITASDLLGVTPEGPDTYALAEMVPQLSGLKIVQFMAGLDPLDDEECMASFTGPKLEVRLPEMLHDMDGAGPEFLSELDKAIAWTLKPTP